VPFGGTQEPGPGGTAGPEMPTARRDCRHVVGRIVGTGFPRWDGRPVDYEHAVCLADATPATG